ncbi:MAG: hypothetical protein ACKPHU_19785, partial [Planctomycetaceae bacterium]
MKPVQPIKLLLALALAAPASAQPPEEGRRDGERPAPEQQEGQRRDGERQEGERPEGERPAGRRREGERPDGERPPGPPGGRREGEGRFPGGPGMGGQGMFGGRGQEGRGFGGMFPNPLLAAIDKNGDGELSEEEIDGAIIALKTLDRNKDRRLDASELRPNMPAMMGGMMGGGGFPPGGPEGGRGGNNQGGPGAMLERMLAMDANGDGKLSGDELPERMKPMLERSDANKDGFLDREELQSMASQ